MPKTKSASQDHDTARATTRRAREEARRNDAVRRRVASNGDLMWGDEGVDDPRD